MKKFSKQVFVFIVPLILLATILEGSLRQIPNDYEFKNSQLELRKDSIKTLLIGSSHIMYGLNPDYFKKSTYNLGHVSQTIDIDYYLLEKYLTELPKLETVVMRLSYTTLHEQIKTGLEAWRLKDYNLYYNLNISNSLKYKSEILSVKLKNNLTRLKDYYIKNQKMITVEPSGWAHFEKDKADMAIELLGFDTAKRHTIDDDISVRENLEFLNKIATLCRDKGVNLLLITLPAHQSYIDNLVPEQLSIVTSAGKRMQEDYDNCEYLNLLGDKSFQDNDFYDPDHLNRNGSQKLSILVNSFISEL